MDRYQDMTFRDERSKHGNPEQATHADRRMLVRLR
jgi:hypothetical protein